ncbi:hypothetical protein AVEN_258515-1 [Araneus ventricosus]|uniref:Uncharacterized protein n=1 Tax=Araneus ventricosus TaxID=182803 RepID=A0A4Y2GV32_ARAVE|nr:hypothetical protein AVEN_258515-1 [Araneus ventricosus]
MNDQLLRQTSSTIAPITRGSCGDPLFYWDTTRHRIWALRAQHNYCTQNQKREPVDLYGGFSFKNSWCPRCEALIMNLRFHKTLQPICINSLIQLKNSIPLKIRRV